MVVAGGGESLLKEQPGVPAGLWRGVAGGVCGLLLRCRRVEEGRREVGALSGSSSERITVMLSSSPERMIVLLSSSSLGFLWDILFGLTSREQWLEPGHPIPHFHGE